MIDLSQDACDARLLTELEFITQQADTCWNQNIWGITGFDRAHFYPDEKTPCGTKACLAGWAAIHAGLAQPMPIPIPPQEMGDRVEYFLEINEAGQELIQASGFAYHKHHHPNYDISQDFFALGTVLFGLGERQKGHSLFRSNHTLGSLWSTAAKLTEGRVSLPEALCERVRVVDVARYERARR